MTIAGAMALAVNTAFGEPVERETMLQMIALLSAYVLGQAAVDVTKARKNGEQTQGKPE